eukprot:TRINITY_DN3004_c0_g1_i3.p2 TRINITY_DN3004_c0_g1~~TRINITY_DN3004_c0_g1_i3.p2  ORF type:complete len:186 (-),score=3.58 TRINITY_DN3004_c0_g1_i3:89-646(-)
MACGTKGTAAHAGPLPQSECLALDAVFRVTTTGKKKITHCHFLYKGANSPCPHKCVNGQDWDKAHVCNCVGGFKTCVGIDVVKSCLKSGPITVAFGVCRSFFNYRSGIYKCDCNNKYVGLHAVLAMGYSDTPACHYHVKNSWGTSWGMQGYFDIQCDQCGISGTYANGNVMCEKVEPQLDKSVAN